MIRLVASDIDGTIIGENNQITSQNLKAIQDMRQSHIDFTICTGKPYSMVKNFCENLHASYGIFVFCNQIMDLKTGLTEELLKNEEITNSKEYYLKCLYLLFEHIEHNKEVYSPLIVNNRNSIAMDMIYDTLLEDITKRMNLEGHDKKRKIPADFVTHFYLGAIFQIGMKWIQRKNYYSKEEVLSYLEHLIPNDLS